MHSAARSAILSGGRAGRAGRAHGLELISSLPPRCRNRRRVHVHTVSYAAKAHHSRKKLRAQHPLSAIINIQYVSPWWQWTRNVMESAVFVLIRKEGCGLDRFEEVYGISVTEDTDNTV